MLLPSYFPLYPAVLSILRDRLARCAPFTANFKFEMFCPDNKVCPVR